MTAVTEADDLLLPEGTRLLHIGPQKTGSTALQSATHDARQAMRQHGVTAVGTQRAERKALWAALMHHDSTEERYRRDFGRWDAMVAEVARAEGRVFLSNESLGKADDDGARRMVEALGGDRAHVVAVARRLDRLLPSQWQQRVKMHATTLSYDEWLEVVLGDHPDDPVWRNIWVPHDLGGLVRRWSAASGDRFTLVIADESDRRLLSRTVEHMLGLPGGLLTPGEWHKDNASLSYGRLEVIRLLNAYLDSAGIVDRQLRSRVSRWVKSHARSADERRVPPLSDWAHERVVELSEARADLVKMLGIRVVGNPDDLRVPPAARSATESRTENATVPADVAARAIAEAVLAARGQG